MKAAIQERYELADGTVLEKLYYPKTHTKEYRTESGRYVHRYQAELLIKAKPTEKLQ